MRKIKIRWRCNETAEVYEQVFEVDEDCTDYDIDDLVYDEVMEHISWGWEEVNNDNDCKV